MGSNSKNRQNTRMIAGCGVLIAVAVILQYIEVAIPIMPSFIKLDFSDLPEIIGAFAYGPIAGVTITIIKNIIHLLASQSGFVGELSNALLGCTFSFVAGAIYMNNKTKKGAIIGGILGAVAMAIISFPTNLFIIYPMYINVIGFPLEAILKMYRVLNPNVETLTQALLWFNVPFTLFKGLIDVFFCLLIYKRISPILHNNSK
ncbi:MAG: ECF transporter S component [Sphaerochaetaceae bacterium]|nr:ECF transporter S component [Sphaerochaetaceae bacterium]